MTETTRPVRALPLQKETATYCRYTLQIIFMSYQTNPSKRNAVKGCHPLNGTASFDRGSDAPQVCPDPQQATALNSKLNLKKKIKITTWNVRTMNARGKLENVKREMERLNVNILGDK